VGVVDHVAEELDLVVAEPVDLNETTADKATTENYDPTLDLARYQYPTLELMNEYGTPKIQVSKEELEANKDRIVETLSHYNITIASIKATIGPTVTLYEIVPDAGIRISKIKSLEDDIALSLAALGIRIIAPIPGKGTIGIEVPNKQKEMVAMRSVISTEKFMRSDMELPIAFGKTIQNEVFIADLAKMPHLLMAGATGQGKSVGLNVILTSLLYKRHPSQLKFVLVDPKKVELSLFNKIERHFLAKLPDSEEAIITDTKKVVNTLNSLCMEMDQRYDLLKEAGCRNLKEYNLKFVERRLNPKKGHKFLPYIVLVIDELADLMMTAGKEVETPIARLAQLARAIGIHLIVATQRPSVNVITGIIKANFPARISFKVTSKIDSRTILDQGGADQLIGQGDMLFSIGSDLIRVQCAFVDTPEVDRICDFIGDQQGYDSAYLLPEFAGDDAGGAERKEFDPKDRDVLFSEAARIIVTHQQGSTSLLQRRLNLGYNRAGRLIDQLEGAGVVGPFEGSKAREVLIPDEYSLEQLLNSIE
ncbi:MAG: DNA translocase FtsK, partial [Sphingobacteriales bacterium]